MHILKMAGYISKKFECMAQKMKKKKKELKISVGNLGLLFNCLHFIINLINGLVQFQLKLIQQLRNNLL